MPVSIGPAGIYSSRPNKGSRKIFLWVLYFFVLSALGYGVYHYREQIFFRFERDQQGEILRRLAENTELVRKKASGYETPAEIAKDKALVEYTALLESMTGTEHLTGLAYFARGKLLYELFIIIPARNQSLYYDIFFFEFIERYSMSRELDVSLWQQAILFLRKSMVLNLPEEQKEEAALLLAELYFWGGKSYWASAYDLLEQYSADKEELIRHLFNILLGRQTPNFDKLTAVFGEEPVTLWRSIYYLKAGNAPLAYSLLYRLADSATIQQVKNNALYLLGKLQGRDKHYRQQIYYYRRIEPAEFLLRAPWFLEEFIYVLRFVGENSEAQRFAAQYEKLVLEQQKPL